MFLIPPIQYTKPILTDKRNIDLITIRTSNRRHPTTTRYYIKENITIPT